MAERGLPDVEVFDLFVVDDDGHLATAEPWQWSSTPPEQPQIEVEPVEPLPKPRPAAGGAVTPAPPVRVLGLYDVFQAVAIDPTVSARLLQADEPFAGVTGIEIDPASRTVEGSTLTWQVRLRIAPGRWRDAELLVHPSPSWVVTVVELRPASKRRATRAFIRGGVEVVGELTAWLAARAG